MRRTREQLPHDVITGPPFGPCTWVAAVVGAAFWGLIVLKATGIANVGWTWVVALALAVPATGAVCGLVRFVVARRRRSKATQQDHRPGAA